jgi:membrane protease YdiL (CAAX protease family)
MNARNWVAIELAGIAVAALVFVGTVRVRPPYLDFALAAAAVALIALSARRSTRLWLAATAARGDARGREAWLASIAFTAVALIALGALAALGTFDASGSSILERARNWHIVLAIALYFPWALLQQYIFQFYLLGRLLHLMGAPAAIALTAIAFACVHFPRWPVMTVVAVAGAVWALIYYRHRTLLPLAASHAVLGSALHYWVFGNDLLNRWLP